VLKADLLPMKLYAAEAVMELNLKVQVQKIMMIKKIANHVKRVESIFQVIHLNVKFVQEVDIKMFQTTLLVLANNAQKILFLMMVVTTLRCTTLKTIVSIVR
jgi:hypothetical protein